MSTHRPPRSVRLVVLELSGQEHGNEDLEDAPLHTDHSDETQHGMRRIPQFQEPEELEKGNHAYYRAEMGNGSHGRSELVGARIKARSKEDGNEEESDEQCHVPYDRTECDEGDSE